MGIEEILSWPFGGGKEGGVEKISTMSPEQRKLQKKLLPFLGERIGEGLPRYEGDFTAPLGELEEFGLGQFKEAVTGFQPEEISDWYMKYIAPSEQRYLKDVALPTFKEAQVPGGTLRSTGTERGMADIISQFGEAQLGRIGEAIMGERARVTGALPGFMEAAQLPRMIEQQELTSRFQEFMRTTPELSPIIGDVLAALGMQTQAGFYRPDQPSFGEQLLPVLGQGLGAYLGAQ